MLEHEEILELEDRIREVLDERLLEILYLLNRKGELEDFLAMLGIANVLKVESSYQVHKTGTIVVIGQSQVKPDVLLGIAKELGIDKSRFELHLEYEDAKTFEFEKMHWCPNYSAVLCGPMPHSTKDKGDYGSVISNMEHEDGYPPVKRLISSNGELKITKSTFRTALKELKDAGDIL